MVLYGISGGKFHQVASLGGKLLHLRELLISSGSSCGGGVGGVWPAVGLWCEEPRCSREAALRRWLLFNTFMFSVAKQQALQQLQV